MKHITRKCSGKRKHNCRKSNSCSWNKKKSRCLRKKGTKHRKPSKGTKHRKGTKHKKFRMDRRPVKNTGISYMTHRANYRNQRELDELEARQRSAKMAHRMKVMNAAKHHLSHRLSKNAYKR
tara:strand:- start:179 stop:544 length:366 start_codon:yes stop_codon:yes gene_type:complete